FSDCTRVDVTLETGRRNQIRVHFSEDGHPVIGDVRYQASLAGHPLWRWPRLALHAAELGFEHPVTKRPLHFTSPLPAEFGEFDRALAGAPAGPEEPAERPRRPSPRAKKPAAPAAKGRKRRSGPRRR